jgi:hypothetical protein
MSEHGISPVASIIWSQLGGHKFDAMTGAKFLSSTPDSVTFSLPSRFANKQINRVVVRLDPFSDTYTVVFQRASKDPLAPPAKVVSDFNDVYAEDLRELFERETGLYLSL